MVTSDALVVGGGPAGSVTALLLARGGFHVTLLERQRFPRAKPCGDCLSPAANRILRDIGVWDAVLRARPALLRGWQLTSPGQAAFSAMFDAITRDPFCAQSIALPRDQFDAILLDEARHAGVDVIHDAHVVDVLRSPAGAVVGVRARQDQADAMFRARLTIGADGLRSVVARRLNAYARAPRLRKVSFTVHAPWQGRDAVGEMRVAADACLGIAPVAAGTGRRMHNLTLVLKRDSYDARAGVRSIVAAGLEKFGVTLDNLADTQILTSGPFDWPVRDTVFDGAALVGDAAGYYDPFTGQGIYQALTGARLLAEHAADSLRADRVRKSALRGYARAHRQLTASTKRVQRIIEFVCARPWLADLAFAKIGRDAALAHTLAGVTGDLLPVTSLFSPRFLMRLAT